MTQEEENEKVWKLPSYKIRKKMTLREDMYSLLFVSLVKPQYKKYCDLVARTNRE